MSELINVIQKNTDLRLDDFKSMEEVYRYVDAIASSGSTEEAKGCVFVLGNTSSGKSSLVQTLQNYCNDRIKTPKPFLTGDEENKAHLETRVLDIVGNLKLHGNDQKQLKIRREHHEAKLGVIEDTSKEEPCDEALQTEEETLEQIEVSFVDFGGHTEYASCSPIFIKEKAVFLICFPMAKFKNEPALDGEYFPSIGTYIQLISENCEMPIIFLVATKGDEVKDPAAKGHLSSVLETAKEQLETIAKKSNNKKPFIFDRVVQTSLNKGDLKLILDDLMENLVAIFGHSELMDVQPMAVPKSWRKTIDVWRSTRQKITIDEAVLEFEKITTEHERWKSKAGNIEVSDKLDQWKNVAEKLVTFSKKNRSQDVFNDNVQNNTPSLGAIPSQDSALEISSAPKQEGPAKAFEPNDGMTFVKKRGVSRIMKSIERYLCLSREGLSGNNTEISEIPLELVENEDISEKRKNVEGIFSFFSSGNEILWFR